MLHSIGIQTRKKKGEKENKDYLEKDCGVLKQGTRLGSQNGVGLRARQPTGMVRRDDNKVRKK